MEDSRKERSRYIKATERLRKLKKFYRHLVSYIIVNLFISISKIASNMNNGETFSEAFWDFGTFAVWFFWGIGIFFHAMAVFKQDFLFSREWEERKINEFVDEEKQQWK